jgi:hypothetical protein
MKTDGQVYFDRDTGKGYTSATPLIDAYIARFSSRVSAAAGKDVRFSPLDKDGYSFVVRGSATVGINVLEDRGIILLLSKIMTAASDLDAEFLKTLLELNYSATSEGAFALDRGVVYLRASRSVAGLDYEEFEELLHSVATVADEWDDKLKARFGGR